MSAALRQVSRQAVGKAARLGAQAANATGARTMSMSVLPRSVGRLERPVRKATVPLVQARGIKTLDFGGTQETVYERSDWPLSRLHDYFKNDTICVLGYGSQGRGQALNAKDQGMNVIIGVRKDGKSWKEAVEDGWKPGSNLYDIDEALQKGTIIMNMLSDAAQSLTWKDVSKHLTKGKTLMFAHGFSVVYKDDTKVVPPKDIDVILVAPKGSGRTVRNLFVDGKGINASIGVYQDVSGKALERAQALGIAVGAGYLYETTFEKEVYSDLVGERGVLMGAIQGIFLAQYEVLRANGHSPSEAFNETCEEATQSLYPLVGKYGMDYMYAACSTTARRGALDWMTEFHKANKPIFEKLYEEVKNGNETRRTLEFNARPSYDADLRKELDRIDSQEMWKAGKTVRALRPENVPKQQQ